MEAAEIIEAEVMIPVLGLFQAPKVCPHPGPLGIDFNKETWTL